MERNETSVIDAIMARRSVRQYKDIPVERELLQQIAVCGVNAPDAKPRDLNKIQFVD